jgi:pimeloyl-ACP methyl ester carboxylesterase
MPVDLASEALAEGRAVARAVLDLRADWDGDDVEAAVPGGFDTPVVLVHGAGHRPVAWRGLRPRLVASGFSDVRVVTYDVWKDSIEEVAPRLDDAVRAACAEQATDAAHVIGHSLGGVIARVWAMLEGGEERAVSITTLGSPHFGSAWLRVPLTPETLCELRERTELRGRLDHLGPAGTRWTTIAGGADRLVPPRRAHLPGAVQRTVRGVGHLGLLYAPAAAAEVLEALLAAEDDLAARAATRSGE